MGGRDATRHFGRIANLLGTIELTDRAGNSLSVDEGSDAVVERISAVGVDSGKILLIGNGGSASIGDHMQMDLCTRCHLQAKVFTEPAVLTALSNDLGYDRAFERMVSIWARKPDCLVAISSSGQSENIHRAVQAGRQRGCDVITFSGFAPDNPLRSLGDHNYYVASSHYGEVEVVHHALGHYLTDRVVEIVSATRVG